MEIMKKLEEKEFLPLNLQFFAEGGDGNGDGGNQDQNNGQGSHNPDGQGADDGSQQKQDITIPKSRFDEVNNKYKELQKQLETFTKQQQDAEQKRQQEELEAKKKNGEFEKLYTETSSELEGIKSKFTETSSRVEQLEGVIQTLVEAELKSIPEDLHDLIPANMTPEQKLTWISTAKAKGIFGNLEQKQNTPLGGSTNGGQPPKTDVSKMSVTEMLRHAYGSKK